MIFLQLIFVNCLCTIFIHGSNEIPSLKLSYKHCQLDSHQETFDVLPGSGWDNLANIGMGRILDLNFSQCLFSNDNKYLIPNQLDLTPEKLSKIKMHSDIFTHFANYTSMTSESINVNLEGTIKIMKLGGTFSYENIEIKKVQLETKSIFTRIQLRHLIYQAKFEPDTPLFPNFRNRILDIAGLVVENKDSLYPAYLADMIVRDYGTHVIRSIDVGAVLFKTDALSAKYAQKYQSDSNEISLLASASFFSLFNMSQKLQIKKLQQNIDEYNENTFKTYIDTVGGGIYGAKMSLSEWEKTVLSNLVPINRRGEPLYYVITPRTFPELDDEIVNKVYILLKEAIERYYSRNSRKGCLNINSPNFNPDANIDSGSCESPSVNFTFGGIYQTCDGPSCSTSIQRNPLTGLYSCPPGFSSMELHQGIARCDDVCHGWWLWRTCEPTCSHYATYWCYPDKVGPNYNGYQFGGIRQITCPIGYIPLKLGLRTEICVTSDTDPSNPYAIKFGGLFSCSAGNPLANGKEKILFDSKTSNVLKSAMVCAKGYVAHIASIEEGCQISYCTETNKVSLGHLPKLMKPPFISLDYNPNSTQVTDFSTLSGRTMVKDNAGSWKLDDLKNDERYLIGTIISLSLVIVICLIVLFVQRTYYKRKMKSVENIKLIDKENRFGIN